MNLTISSLTAIFISFPSPPCAAGLVILKWPNLSTSRSGKKEKMRCLSHILIAVVAALAGQMVSAADNSVLIQLEPDGHYKLWHTEGMTSLSDDEVLTVAANARPEGGDPVAVAAGTARAYETSHGVVIAIPEAKTDQALLVDRDECGAIKLWHSDGSTALTEEQMTELVISALPGGGRPVNLGGRYAKAFIGRLGYTVVLWKPVQR
jgi:hypothetical protein